jgi:hypothetical protein
MATEMSLRRVVSERGIGQLRNRERQIGLP